MIIYKITNLINGKAYIGQTIQKIEKRWSSHCKLTSHCFALNNAIKKYGRDNFKIEKLAEASNLKDLNNLEKAYIAEQKSMYPFGYNLTSGGDAFSHSEITIKKLSILNTGDKNAFFGKKHTQESRDKIKKARSEQNMSYRDKKVVDNFGNIFKNPKEAGAFYKKSNAAIRAIANGKNKKTKEGVTFSYYKG